MIYPFVTGMGRFEYRPAIVPADYIGPRLDCPMPLRDDDSPLDGKKFDAWEHIETSVWLEELQSDVPVWVATSNGPAPAPVNPALPGPPGVIVFPNTPPCCDFWPGTPGKPGKPGTPGIIITPPDGPEPAPVWLDGSGSYMGGALIALLMLAAALKWTNRFTAAQRKAN